MALFLLKDLTFVYPDAMEPAIDGVNLEVASGEYVCLIGPSGCGKTTLLRQLKSALTPHGSLRGEVLFDGVPLASVSQWEQASRIGFVMQDPDAQIVTDKVWHELAFGLESLGIEQSAMRLHVAEMASYFGIQDWFCKDVQQLSGGQKQLLNLASVMAMQPDVLILDEPTSQLDPIAASDFLNTIRKVNREFGTTIIMTEHRLEDIYATADRVAVMNSGHLVVVDTPYKVARALYMTDDSMTFALPTPVRVFYGVERRDANAMTWKTLDRVLEPAELDASGKQAASKQAGNKQVGSKQVSSKHVKGKQANGKHINGRQVSNSCDATVDVSYTSMMQCPLTVRDGRTWLTDRVQEVPPIHTEILTEPYEIDAQEIAVRLKDVWFRYKKDAPDVLKGVDLVIPVGQLHALVGGNGVGKSTLLKSLCSVIKPYRGKIWVLGRRLKDWKEEYLFHGGIGMLPQDPQSIFAKKTVWEELEEMLPQTLDREETQKHIVNIASRLSLEGLLDQHPLDVSGGEQQRVALAKILLTKPKILLLDEPTKGMDSFFKRTLAGLLGNLTACGMTIIMVSHDIEFCARSADVVSLFFDGMVVSTNTPHEFFASSSFYTTAASRMSRHVFAHAITDEDIVELCVNEG